MVDISYDTTAREGLKRGVDKLADAVKVTLGGKGRNVAYYNMFGVAGVTKDGVTVANEVELEEPIEAMGAEMVREASRKAAEEAGDGTTTATVIAQELIAGGTRLIMTGTSPISIKRGMDKAVVEVSKILQEMAIPVKDNETIKNVASISANSDPFIGGLISEAVDQIGHSGNITFEESNATTTYVEIGKGMKIDSGYARPEFITEDDKAEAILNNPLIWVFNGKITGMSELLPLLEPLAFTPTKEGRELLIIADSLEGDVLSTIVANKLRGFLKVVVVRSPEFADYRKDLLEDLCIYTGATLTSDNIGISVRDVKPEYFGTAEKVIINKKSTLIINGKGDIQGVADRIALLSLKRDDAEVPALREEFIQRIGNLIGGVAVIKVGAKTPVELKEKKDRVEDAVSATRAAIEEGVVAGGGVALLRASKKLAKFKSKDFDENLGIQLVLKSITAPIKTILSNAGLPVDVIIHKLNKSALNVGYDVNTDTYVDMMTSGIIDPKKVTRVALESAVSVAGMILLTECVLAPKSK